MPRFRKSDHAIQDSTHGVSVGVNRRTIAELREHMPVNTGGTIVYSLISCRLRCCFLYWQPFVLLVVCYPNKLAGFRKEIERTICRICILARQNRRLNAAIIVHFNGLFFSQTIRPRLRKTTNAGNEFKKYDAFAALYTGSRTARAIITTMLLNKSVGKMLIFTISSELA